MSYAFHDIKHVIKAYLDDLAASLKRINHPSHLQLVFEGCRFYKIQLNPNKCILAVTSDRLLGFIVSTEGIRVDPFRVEALVHQGILALEQNTTDLKKIGTLQDALEQSQACKARSRT